MPYHLLDRKVWMKSPLTRYIAVGAFNTVAGLLVIYACKWIFAANDVTANAVGYAVGISLGFQLNRRWTFRSRAGLYGSFSRYLAVLAGAYLVNLAFVMFAVHGLRINSYAAQALGIVPYTVLGYVGSRHFAFIGSDR
jgi:putative flippase GtrA